MTDKEVIEWLKSIDKKYIHGGDEWYDEQRHEAIKSAIKALEERPKGQWELFEKRPCQNLYMCSNCGHLIESMPDRLAENFKGCYCGADMRGDENA